MAAVQDRWTLMDQQGNELKRFRITAELETASSLHIGASETVEHDLIKNDDGTPVQINAVITGAGGLPIIPGSTIKGRFLARLRERGVDRGLLETLFGKGHDRETEDQGRGGRAEFHDAPLCHRLSGARHFPYWRPERQTWVKAQTAVDRHRGTALRRSLRYTEMVPPGVRFRLTITGCMTDAEADVLFALLEDLGDPRQACSFGSAGADGNGTMRLFGRPEVYCLDRSGILGWLASFEKGGNGGMAMTAAALLQADAVQRRADKVRQAWQPPDVGPRLHVELRFSGPFLVNDPSRNTPDIPQAPDMVPLVDEDGNPMLPASSFRGALRAQAERIIRTLGGRCCDTSSPCRPLESSDKVGELCLACQVFGAPGWGTTLHIQGFTCTSVFRREQEQTFVAIDRFHGGCKEGALYTIRHAESPRFEGHLVIDPRMPAWGRGLLALVLRDLREGDITFGLGAGKGYGVVEAADVQGMAELEPHVDAFREQCRQDRDMAECHAAPSPPPLRDHDLAEIPPAEEAPGETFLNPYHFVPIREPDTGSWLARDDLDSSCCHSHGFYRQQVDDRPLYHGRLTCLLETETPLFIGTTGDSSVTSCIENYRLGNRIAIPAASLRGMLSSLAEAASNSAMRVLHQGILSYRKKAKNALREIGMIVLRDGKRFILPLVPLMEVTKLRHAYTDPAMKHFLDDKNSWSPRCNRVYYLGRDGNQIPAETRGAGMRPGILRLLGREGRHDELQNKKHEYFIEIPERYVDQDHCFDYRMFIRDRARNGTLVPISPVAWERYHCLAEERTLSQKNDPELQEDKACTSPKWLPFHLKGRVRERDPENDVCHLSLRHGDLVFYAEQNRVVSEISFSAIWRSRVETSDRYQAVTVDRFVPKELRPFNRDRRAISPAELLFGFVELDESENSTGKSRYEQMAFAGKVRLTAGLPVEDVEDSALLEPKPIVLKALSSPKPPSPPFYFVMRDGSGAYIAKKDLSPDRHRIKGRKQYLHGLRQRDNPDRVQSLDRYGHATETAANPPWETCHPEERPQIKVRVQPVRRKTKFFFHLDFSNLSRWELGLLCYVLRPTACFRHKLGMGKPLGLGSVRIDIASLQLIDRVRRYGTDDLTAGRYNMGGHFNASCLDLLPQQDSPAHDDSGAAPDPGTLRQDFVKTMDETVFRALDLLGNPAHVQRPVHYPQVREMDIEDQTFLWFVDNDKRWQDALQPLTSSSTQLPPLTRRNKR